jgi:hypothetical protein
MKKTLAALMMACATFAFVATGCQSSVDNDTASSGDGYTPSDGTSSGSGSSTSGSGSGTSDLGTTTKTNTTASATNGKLDMTNGGDTINFKKYCTTDFSVGVWYCYDLDWDDITTPDVDEGLTAIVSKGDDGGYHIVAQKRKCGATYFGCNLAGGSNYGAVADISGAGFTQIRFKIRGNVPASSVYVAAIITLGSDTFVIGKPEGKMPADGKANTMAIRCAGYNSSTWTECTVPITPNGAKNFTYSSVFCIATIDGIPDKSWVEVKEVEWLDADGNNVAPYKL